MLPSHLQRELGMIRTHLGPVDLRKKKDKRTICLHYANKRENIQIQANWLKPAAKDQKGGGFFGGGGGQNEEKMVTEAQKYRNGVMQAMMIAATEMDIQDLTGRASIDPETGRERTPEKVAAFAQGLKTKLKNLTDGTAPIPMRKLSVSQGVAKQEFRAKKHDLQKRGRKTRWLKKEFFSIDTGKLLVFRDSTDVARPRAVYSLSDAECRYEYKGMSGLTDEFEGEWKARLKVQLRERPHGALYLMATDDREAKSWERAVKMSKYLQSASDREALAFVIGRLAGCVMFKGWQALFAYAKEINQTRQLVKNLAMRLMRVDFSRAWTKARAVYVQRFESDKLRNEQQQWAAKFLKEKMERIGTQQARSPKLVRASIIAQIQTKFRQYRQEKIFDRAYPLGSSVATRLQQAQAGTSMGSAFNSLTREDALHLVLNDESRMLLTMRPEIFHSKKTTYSEVIVPVCQLSVNVSESFTMLSFAELDEEAEHSHLAKAGWAHFVNLDQISSVVLHSERMMGQGESRNELPVTMTRGVWFTIHGPRVCWCRQLRTYVDSKTKEFRKDLVGATNPLVVGSCLAKGERLRWFKVGVSVQASYIPRLHPMTEEEEQMVNDFSEENEDGTAKPSNKERRTYMVLHVLGRQFKSDRVTSEAPVYPGRFEAEVPISYDEQALAALDESEIGVDIVEWNEDPKLCEVIFAGKMSLWKIFGPEESMADHVNTAERAFGGQEFEDVISMAQTLSSSAGRAVKRVPLVHSPNFSEQMLPRLGSAHVDVEVTARVQESVDPSKRCISPELQGRGPLSTLFSTHRGAWYDPKLGEAKFFADRVANFIELSIKDLLFPTGDKVDQTRVFRYRVVAKCNGVTQSTMPLHRSKEVWGKVMAVDPNKIDFKGTKLFLPLPPGAWCAREVRPEIEFFILRSYQIEERTLSFFDLTAQNGKPGPQLPAFEKVYHATVSLDGMLLDQVKEGARILLSRASNPMVGVSLATGDGPHIDNPCALRIDAVLRDRDYARLHSPSRGMANDMGQGSVLCIGDKAMMRVEEPLAYPQTELEFRRRFLPGTWDAKLAQRGLASTLQAWSAPLRDPSMSHEYADSRLDDLIHPPPFKQRYLPTNCEDVVPYKFVLPESEFDYMREARPGIYWRIMEQLVDQKVREEGTAVRDQRNKVIVEEITHLVRHVPCTVLAVYANETCDVELSPNWVEAWEQHPERLYTIPGAVMIKKFQDTSQAHLRLAPPGAGDVGERFRLRVILREVPMGALMAVQATGFNVYDARFGNVDDAIKVAPGTMGNDFNPRGMTDTDDPAFVGGRRGGYSIHAGPVPADAGPTCLYEWSLYLHAESEDEMYHFVTALRQSARMDLFQQLLKLDEFKKKSALSAASMPYRMGPVFSTAAGHLEVVLVQARHLKPPQILKDKDVATTMMKMMDAELHPMALFTMRHSEKVSDKSHSERGEELIFHELIYRGSKTQFSPSVSGNSPNWSTVEELEKSGGWVFRSPPIDPDKMKDLYFEIELKHKKPSGAATTRIGLVRVPVNGKGYSGIIDYQDSQEPEKIIVVLDTATQGTWTYKDKTVSVRVKRDGGNKVSLDDGTMQLEGSMNDSGVIEGTVQGRPSSRFTLKPNVKAGIIPASNLCNAEEPFNNLWVPLHTEHPEAGDLVPEPSLTGKVHVMTFWVPQLQSSRAKRMPKKARDWRLFELKHKLHSAHIREHIYGACDVQVHKHGYNPNLWQDSYPLSRSEAVATHIEAIDDTVPYLECAEEQDRARWAKFRQKLHIHSTAHAEEGGGEEETLREKPLGHLRLEWKSDPSRLYELDEVLRRGIPHKQRKHTWFEIALADECLALYSDSPGMTEIGKKVLAKKYRELVGYGRKYRNDAMNQLNEDLIAASGWEGSQQSSLMDQHLKRVNRAQDICIALIAFSLDGDENKPERPPYLWNYKGSHVDEHSANGCNGLAYCESLLVLAFYLMMVIGYDESGASDGQARSGGMSPSGKSSSVGTRDSELVDESESQVFWLLYTLSGYKRNRVFRDYYGTVPPGSGTELADRRGAMEDVHRLHVALARYERQLWVHFNALGFHLAVVFHGAFMRLFATYLPTTSCFRFWDLLFAESTKSLPHKPARHSLIDLAFGVLCKDKSKLLKCNSALEVKDAIRDYLEHMYEPSEVIAVATEMERFLWDQPALEAVGMEPSHVRDYNRARGLWEQYLHQFRVQNAELKKFTYECNVSTKTVNKAVKQLRGLFGTENAERGQYYFMQRTLPPKIFKLGPDIDQSLVGTVTSWFSRLSETMIEDVHRSIAVSVPRPADIPENPIGEPTQVDSNEFERQMSRIPAAKGESGVAWTRFFQQLFLVFASQTERRLSINEFFAALICCSRGTVGEKAMGLFSLFGCVQQKHAIHHITTISHTAATVVERIDNSLRQAEGMCFKEPQDPKKMALHFKVFTYGHAANEVLIGEIFVPTLRPFLWNSMGRDSPQNHYIFGMVKRLPPGVMIDSSNREAMLNEHGIRQIIGKCNMSIKWMPVDSNNPDVGQLGLHLHYIAFDGQYVDAPERKNPRMSVVTYDEQGQEVQIKRWDPRGILKRAGNTVTVGYKYGGAYGEFVDFEETSYRDPSGTLRSTQRGHWKPDEKKWVWNDHWGDQYSVEKTRMRKDVTKSPGARPNSISLRACRVITKAILSRCLQCVTNRQAILMSDQIFSRAGAVPGILDALLVDAESVNPSILSVAQLRTELERTRRSFADVKYQVSLLHEQMIDRCPGDISLFPAVQSHYSLHAMEIHDPFPGNKKVLWIRYIRAGDGQRLNVPIPVHPDGTFDAKEIAMDLEVETASGKIQMSVTKEEFVTCVLANPLLSECLRQLSTTDNHIKDVPMQKESLNLDVAVADPTGEEEEDDFLDIVNVRQFVLFELWDSDPGMGRFDDFLGECSLPPFSQLTAEVRQYVLEIRNAPADDASISRPDKRKIGPKCTGTMHIEAAWKFPHQDVDEVVKHEEVEERVKREKALHTGELYLKIVKAQNLRMSDQTRGSDPYVHVHIRNEVPAQAGEHFPGLDANGWRINVSTGYHDFVMKTAYKSGTVNPVWDEEKRFLLQTGGFERRQKKRGVLSELSSVAGATMKMDTGAYMSNEDRNRMEILQGGRPGGEDLRLYFEDDKKDANGKVIVNTAPGHRHRVKIFATDSIHQFKIKLQKACEEEASLEVDKKKQANYQVLAQGMNYRHLVMVFVPSQKLRELAQSMRKTDVGYKRLYKIEESDPSSWQPLDPIRTFDHYQAMYGFGGGETPPQRLRITEGTDDYRLRNTRYAQFVEDQKQFTRRIEDLNTEAECFGYAKYAHRDDGGSVEWRQALIDRPDIAADGKRRCKTWFMHSPGNPPVAGAPAVLAPGQAFKEDMPWEALLPAPAHPRILNSSNVDHQEFLAKASALRDEGRSEVEITSLLNRLMKAKYVGVAKADADAGFVEPPPIMLSDVQYALKREDSNVISGAALPRRLSAHVAPSPPVGSNKAAAR